MSEVNHPFPTSTRQFAGVWAHFHKLNCRTCSASEEIRAGGGAAMPEEAVSKKFAQLGWDVGKNRRNDICPACKRKPKIQKLECAMVSPTRQQGFDALKDFRPNGAMKPVPAAGPVQTPRAALPLSSDENRIMSRDDKKVIFVKLTEVYLDEKRGYADKWTDAEVAKHLGVPRKWVEDIREADFGPVKENDAIRELRDNVQNEILNMRAMADSVIASANDTAKRINERADRLESRLSAVEKSLK